MWHFFRNTFSQKLSVKILGQNLDYIGLDLLKF